MKNKKPRKPKEFSLNCMNVYCVNDGGIRCIDLYINGKFEYDFLNVKKFHEALGKALEWAEYQEKRG